MHHFFLQFQTDYTQKKCLGGVELAFKKADITVPFWPRLLKSNKKYHNIKIDFAKWIDEDEEAESEARGQSNFGGAGEDYSNYNVSAMRTL